VTRPRDSQRSRVYAWERRASVELAGRDLYEAEFKSLAECEAFAAPIWRKERGRVGLAGTAAPSIERPNRGQRRALAHHDHRITLPKWARSRWVILHELAHRLTPVDEAHGPRFVGVLIGLLSRWLDLDSAELMRYADEGGVGYHVRSIGLVPVHGPAWHVERALRTQAPMTPMDLSAHLVIVTGYFATPKIVRGAALALIRAGKARWLRGKLVPMGELLPMVKPEAAPRPKAMTPMQRLRELAKPHGIEVEADGPRYYWVTHPQLLDTGDDPLEGDHWAASYGEAKDKIDTYITALSARKAAA
jgi:putative metallohydrolase (TIGR04338 family)